MRNKPMHYKVRAGDVVRSEHFVYAHVMNGHMPVVVGIKPHIRPLGLALNDPSRRSAYYVVTQAGDINIEPVNPTDPNDEGLKGWQAVISRLRHDGTWSPQGETLTFFQSGNFPFLIHEIELVGKMQGEVVEWFDPDLRRRFQSN